MNELETELANLDSGYIHFKGSGSFSISCVQSRVGVTPTITQLKRPAHLTVRPRPPTNKHEADWCPDCTRSNAVVREALAAAGKPLLVVDVGTRSDWKARDTPLRRDARFALSGIPTLVRWQGGVVTAKLERPLEHAASPAAALKAVAQFVAAQG